MKEFELPHRHGEKNIESLRKELFPVERFSSATEMFKQLSDPTRARIFWLLCHQEECVINIAAMLDMSSPAVSHHLRLLYECDLISSRRDGKEVYYKASDTEICELLHKTVEQMMEIACPQKASDTTKQIVHNVHEYMLEHISERITIEELSKRFHINTTTLKREFKAVYGMSIAAHMKKHRMDYAARLLKESRKGIAQIALAVGYESQSRFTVTFKEIYGVLPSEYRKKQNL